MPVPAPLLNGTRREYTIERLIEMTPTDPTAPEERRLLGLVLPPWQRPEVWTSEQKQRFIEGIFLGMGCGYYVTNGLDWVQKDGQCQSAPMAGWLLDGQQRIAALRDFLADKLAVFGDVTFSSLSPRQASRFKNENFACFEIEYTDNEDLLKELYDRLNFSGTPHTLEQRVMPDNKKDETKTFLLELSIAQDREVNDPNFAYLAITPELAATIGKMREGMTAAGLDEAVKYNAHFPDFFCDNPGPVVEPHVSPCAPYDCQLVMTPHSFYFNVRPDGHAETVSTHLISFRDIDDRRSDAAALNKIEMRFVSKWSSGETIETACRANPYSGELEIDVADAAPDGSLDREYAVDDAGKEYRVFSTEDGRRLIAPIDFQTLPGNRALGAGLYQPVTEKQASPTP